MENLSRDVARSFFVRASHCTSTYVSWSLGVANPEDIKHQWPISCYPKRARAELVQKHAFRKKMQRRDPGTPFNY